MPYAQRSYTLSELHQVSAFSELHGYCCCCNHILKAITKLNSGWLLVVIISICVMLFQEVICHHYHTERTILCARSPHLLSKIYLSGHKILKFSKL